MQTKSFFLLASCIAGEDPKNRDIEFRDNKLKLGISRRSTFPLLERISGIIILYLWRASIWTGKEELLKLDHTGPHQQPRIFCYYD